MSLWRREKSTAKTVGEAEERERERERERARLRTAFSLSLLRARARRKEKRDLLNLNFSLSFEHHSFAKLTRSLSSLFRRRGVHRLSLPPRW